jgi:hypothetical protein
MDWICCQWLKGPAGCIGYGDLLYGYIVKLGAAAPHAHTSLDLFINLRLEDPKPHPSFSSFFILKSRVGRVCHYLLCAWKRFSVFSFFIFIFYF